MHPKKRKEKKRKNAITTQFIGRSEIVNMHSMSVFPCLSRSGRGSHIRFHLVEDESNAPKEVSSLLVVEFQGATK